MGESVSGGRAHRRHVGHVWLCQVWARLGPTREVWVRRVWVRRVWVRRVWVRRGAEAGYDGAMWFWGLLASAAMTGNGGARPGTSATFGIGVCACLLSGCSGWLAGLYRGRYLRGSFEEVARVSAAGCATVLSLAVIDTWFLSHQRVPLATVTIAATFALPAMLGGRHLMFAARQRSRPPAPTAVKIIIFGAGSAGTQLVDRLIDQPNSGYRPVAVLDGGGARIEGMRDPRISDLLGRCPVHIDVDAVSGCFAGQRILVTGAGGSIGSELCRQLQRLCPAELIMLDRDESALHAVQLALHGRALLDSDETVLADIRDPRRVREVFDRFRPQVVFHVAALKHLPLLERCRRRH